MQDGQTNVDILYMRKNFAAKDYGIRVGVLYMFPFFVSFEFATALTATSAHYVMDRGDLAFNWNLTRFYFLPL
jgi:hypothetical protein